MKHDHDDSMNIFWKCQAEQPAHQPASNAELFAG